ncbi:hypothetical protein [Streptomyces sp. NPDC048659]|uniref:hypothetical protein n=1 Tax=Streptomyces sp. NPDC048659 TaxID=3155489 RepID=UPI00343EEFEC
MSTVSTVCALDLPETAEELRLYRRGGVRLALGGLGVVVLAAVGFGVLPEDPPWAQDLAGYAGLFGMLAVVFGLVRLPLARRFRRILAAGPWTAHPATAVVRSWSGEAVVLATADGGVLPLRVVASRARWEEVRPAPSGVLWWCGDPRTGGVLAAPGGLPLFRAKPVWGMAARQRLLDRADEVGLTALPLPAPPQEARPAPGAPAVARGAGLPSYERFAAHAVSWGAAPPARKRPRGPEADPRTAPWWRLRSLRSVAGLHGVGFGLSGVAVFGGLAAMDLLWPDPESPGGPPTHVVLMMTAAAAFTLWQAFQVWHRGLPVVRVLVRAALAPVPVERRYALVPAPVGNDVFLVLFPAHGGPEDRPEAVLPLLPDQRPVPPTGTAELRGWLDRDGEDERDPVVVPWLGDRPLWPAGPYLEAGTADGAELLGHLAGLLEPVPASGPGAGSAPEAGPGAGSAPEAGPGAESAPEAGPGAESAPGAPAQP